MSEVFNIYCDESCHLENDHQKVMVIGAVWCPLEKCRDASRRIREIKARHRLGPDFEIKWGKVSPAKSDFYHNILDYFFDDDDLHFRAILVPDKAKLDHAAHGQDHDTWYYKMYFDMLKILLHPDRRYRIFIDIKDTCGVHKVHKLHGVLCNNMYDFQRRIIERVQTVRSHEVSLLQLSDLLIGIVAYTNRGLHGSPAKLSLCARAKVRTGYSLTRTTLLREDKFNLLRWNATENIQ